jgi:hypothetical protein
MDDKEIVMIPFVAHESAMNRMERANKRLYIIIVVMLLGILTYLLWPSEIENTSQTVEDVNSSEIHQKIGD